ncbi:MAG: HemK family protein methyltransferase, partial [Betaproteobacteria bacterium]|nr:HemK family protein methyltransferase [Betaproteobacteria bacterium]
MTESLESIRIRAGKRIAAALHISAAASAVETRALARHVLDCDDTELIMRAGQQIAASDQKRIAELVGRRVKGEPIAHLTGSREFYGVHLACSPAALIPRPETELVVDLALARLAPAAVGPIADLGAGCGAITAAIAANRSNLTIDAYERDRPAAQLAARNVRTWSGRVKIIGRSWQQIKSAAYQLIVANPPY